MHSTHCMSKWWPWLFFLPTLAAGLVDEAGRYRAGSDLMGYAPPEPSEKDRQAAVNLRDQPKEKLFKLLYFELWKEEQKPPERRLGVADFMGMPESCEDKLQDVLVETRRVAMEVHDYHLNVTAAAGLYWLLYEHPEEHSWVWLVSASLQRTLRKVGTFIAVMTSSTLDDRKGCFSAGLRATLMNSIVHWKRMHGDYIALLWNSVAFGLLGDVTSWREVDNETNIAEEGPGGPPPNVSWSENLIFGNMWVSGVEKWLAATETDVIQAVVANAGMHQQGIRPSEEIRRMTSATEGVVPTFAFLQKNTFGGWEVDKGLLRGLLRHVLKPEYGDASPKTLGDFGSGAGGYSEWLNQTGLVEAFAFDATKGAQDITGGKVMEADLTTNVQLGRRFMWVLSLDVWPHLPAASRAGFLQTVKRHAELGFVVSGVGGAEDRAVVDEVQAVTGFALDEATSRLLRDGCELPRFAESILVFRGSSMLA